MGKSSMPHYIDCRGMDFYFFKIKALETPLRTGASFRPVVTAVAKLRSASDL